MDMTTHPSIIHEENRSSSGVNNNSSSRRDERNPLLPLTNAHTHSEESSVLKGNGKKFALAGAFAIVATLGVIYQSSAPSSSSMSPGLHDPASTHLEVTVLSSVSFETAAEAQKSESLPDGKITKLTEPLFHLTVSFFYSSTSFFTPSILHKSNWQLVMHPLPYNRHDRKSSGS